MMQEARGKMQDKGIIGSKLTKKCHSERSEESRFLDSSGFTLRMTAIPSFAKICVLILLFLCPDIAHSEIFKWVDDKGEVHFTK